MTTQEHMKAIRERSGNVTIDCKLTSFLYTLMRDYVQPGDIEEIMLSHMSDDPVEYSNGWLAMYANDIASRLKPKMSEKSELYMRTHEYAQIVIEHMKKDNIRIIDDEGYGLVSFDAIKQFNDLMYKSLNHCLIHKLDGKQFMNEIGEVQYDKHLFFDIRQEFPEIFDN